MDSLVYIVSSWSANATVRHCLRRVCLAVEILIHLSTDMTRRGDKTGKSGQQSHPRLGFSRGLQRETWAVSR